MASVLIVGDARGHPEWCENLRLDGHSVETCENSLEFQSRFAADPVDIFIVDVMNADWGEAMLIPPIRAAWPDCRILALASSYAFRSSAVFQMGLWTPDQLLLKPVNPKVLCATVSFLWAQIRSAKIRVQVIEQPLRTKRLEPESDEPMPIIPQGPIS